MKAVVLASLSLLALQQPATLLRRTFQADSVDTYKIEDKVEQTVTSAMGAMPMTITSSRTYAVKTTKVEESGTARFEATTTVDKIDADGPASAMAAQKPGPFTQTGKLDVRGRMTLDPTAPADALAGLMSGTQGAVSAGTFVEFPEKAVKIGDSWEVVVPKSPYLFDQDQRLSETLVGERDLDGTAVWVVALKGTVKTAVDSSTLPTPKGVASPMAIRIKGQDEIAGEGLVEKSTGKTLQMTVKGVSKRTIEIADSGLTLTTDGTVESTVKLERGKRDEVEIRCLLNRPERRVSPFRATR